jgi:hypothetical protein
MKAFLSFLSFLGILAAMGLCFGLGCFTAEQTFHLFGWTHRGHPILFFFEIYFASGFWMYAIFFAPGWACDLVRFRVFQKKVSSMPLSCDVFYSEEEDQGGFPELEFAYGVIYFHDGSAFVTHHRLVFNLIQERCEKLNPLFVMKTCPLDPNWGRMPDGWQMLQS